ncbi:Hypothetical protein D9617_14g076810 [Elsinoe fawcettii]|nr:Hypothetical protein D9617_14g076810 [Elsinoe fawcettii]
MKAAVLARRADVVAPHGSRIFAYRHYLSNQVLYSLSRSLDNTSALKQLMAAGKKTIPRALRKDHWKPFFTVKFGLPHQGLKAFKKLREWRMLHELEWNPKNAKPLEPTVQKQEKLEQEREELEELGGGRIGGKRSRLSGWKLRKKRTIMNQAENSVADLAAVLMEQEKEAINFSIQNEQFGQQALEWVPKLATDQAARRERLESINARVADLEARAQSIKDDSGKRWDLSRASKVRNINREIHLAKTEFHHVRTLPDKVNNAAIQVLSEEKSREYAQILQDQISESMLAIQSARRQRDEHELVKLNLSTEELLQLKAEADAGRPERLDQAIARSQATQVEEYLREHDQVALQETMEKHNQIVEDLKQQIQQIRADIFETDCAIAGDLGRQHRELLRDIESPVTRRNALKAKLATVGASATESQQQELEAAVKQVGVIGSQIKDVQQQIAAQRDQLDAQATPEQKSARLTARATLEKLLAQETVALKDRNGTWNKLLTAKRNTPETMNDAKRARIMQKTHDRVNKLASRLITGQNMTEHERWQDLTERMAEIEAHAKETFAQQQVSSQPTSASSADAEGDNARTGAAAVAQNEGSVTLEVPVEGYGTLAVTRTLQEVINFSIDNIRNLTDGISLSADKDPRNSSLAVAPADEVRLSDVSVEWANPLDAEYGTKWPGEVQHLPMGYTRNTAPAELEERKLQIKDRYAFGKNNVLMLQEPQTSEEHEAERFRIALMEKIMKQGEKGMVQGSEKKLLQKQQKAQAEGNQLARSEVAQRVELKRARKEQQRAEFIAKVEAEEPEKAEAIRRHWAKVEELRSEKGSTKTLA